MAKEPVSKPDAESEADKQLREALDAAGASNTATGPEGSVLHVEGVPGLDAVAGGAGGGGGVESVSGGAAGPAVVTEDDGPTVWVGCKLPQGLDLGFAVLAGTNRATEGAGGYGLTEVPGDAFEQWLKDHPDNVAVKRGLIFKAGSRDKARDQARERSGLTHGFEQLDPEKMPAGLAETDESKAERLKAAKG